VFLLANTELHQLLKLPVLSHHFFQHHQQEPSETFVEFLVEHYINQLDHADKDTHAHDNLPFKTKDCASVHTIVAFFNQHHFSFCKPYIVVKKKSFTYNAAIYSAATFTKIWHPPQFS
jgi:hypothetical protein